LYPVSYIILFCAFDNDGHNQILDLKKLHLFNSNSMNWFALIIERQHKNQGLISTDVQLNDIGWAI
jgi:hypothetical protein